MRSAAKVAKAKKAPLAPALPPAPPVTPPPPAAEIPSYYIELKDYAIKLVLGKTTMADEARHRQIGGSLSIGAIPPEKVEYPPTPSGSSGNGRYRRHRV